ncbi:MAG: PD-(D/E)XK nuclease family protein, partial [Isosphaeraceae bacterium]|nr:PD-(D/E)XK nuclease family protein [Isosphaeraceae bacterium]
MLPVSFSVSEVRVAATCPRILYFDAEHTRRHRLKAKSITRLWKEGAAAETACGSLFHNAIERFNREARRAPEVRAILEAASDATALQRRFLDFVNGRCIDLAALAARSVPQRQAFIRALHVYMAELADIVVDALARGKSSSDIIEHVFGDQRRRVDVTFQVGPCGESVHVTGILDYVFYDWRTANHRIIDYKLTPAHEPTNDLFQVGLYALMHHLQHRTHPDVGVLYLHPERRMFELSWEQVHARRHQVFDLLASMADWVRYDERTGSGLKPPGEPSACGSCRWDRNHGCLARLGPKHEGQRHQHWTEGAVGAPVPGEPARELRAGDGESVNTPGGAAPVIQDTTKPKS